MDLQIDGIPAEDTSPEAVVGNVVQDVVPEVPEVQEVAPAPRRWSHATLKVRYQHGKKRGTIPHEFDRREYEQELVTKAVEMGYEPDEVDLGMFPPFEYKVLETASYLTTQPLIEEGKNGRITVIPSHHIWDVLVEYVEE